MDMVPYIKYAIFSRSRRRRERRREPMCRRSLPMTHAKQKRPPRLNVLAEKSVRGAVHTAEISVAYSQTCVPNLNHIYCTN